VGRCRLGRPARLGCPAAAQGLGGLAVRRRRPGPGCQLLRKAWAVWLFGAGVLGLAVSSVYNFVLSNGLEIMGSEAAMFTLVIWIIALFLFFYALSMAKRGVLR
jgi:hypothetical protein